MGGWGGGYIHSIYGCHSPPEDTQYFLCLMLNLDNTEATFHAVIIQNDYSFPKVRLHISFLIETLAYNHHRKADSLYWELNNAA